MIRVAMVSYWHVHAWDYTHEAQRHPDTSIVAVWDELAERGAANAATLGVPFIADLAELLARDDVDAVIVDAPTVMHHEVMTAAARAGKHIFTEKVLAPTLREAEAIVAAVDRAGVVLTISLPRLYAGYTAAIRGLIADGAFGQLTQVRVRLSHNGALRTERHPDGWLPAHFYDAAATCGGALIDLGCHPMYLTRAFLGLPERVSASYGAVTGRAVEDNAAALLQYADGALGIVEAGFVNPASPFSIELHGTAGSALFGTPDAVLLVNRGAGWQPVALPDDVPGAFDQWVAHIQQGTRATENIAAALDLTALMEAANASAAGGRAVALASLDRWSAEA